MNSVSVLLIIKMYFREVCCRMVSYQPGLSRWKHDSNANFLKAQVTESDPPLRIRVSHSLTATKWIPPVFPTTRKHLGTIMCSVLAKKQRLATSFLQLKNASLILFPLFLEPCLTFVVNIG